MVRVVHGGEEVEGKVVIIATLDVTRTSQNSRKFDVRSTIVGGQQPALMNAFQDDLMVACLQAMRCGRTLGERSHPAWCHSCRKRAATPRWCKHCYATCYCDAQCQTRHRTHHAPQCKGERFVFLLASDAVP